MREKELYAQKGGIGMREDLRIAVSRVGEWAVRLYLRLKYDRKTQEEISKTLSVFFLVLGITMLILPHVLNAQSMTQINPLYTKLTALFRGPIGKTLAVFAFVVAAIVGFMGNLSMAFTAFIVGLLLAFAPRIVEFLFQ